MRYAIFLLLASMVAACSSKNMLRNTQEIQINQFRVQWSELSATPVPVPDGLTPLFFRFSDTSPRSPNGVTQADLEREAAASGVSVEVLKIILGDTTNTYKGANGRLARCTIGAIQAGLCGKPLGLSINQRVELARRAIAETGECKWVSFDPAYNAAVSRGFGAEDFSLHVAARC